MNINVLWLVLSFGGWICRVDQARSRFCKPRVETSVLFHGGNRPRLVCYIERECHTRKIVCASHICFVLCLVTSHTFTVVQQRAQL
jgi:hypothetical protein